MWNINGNQFTADVKSGEPAEVFVMENLNKLVSKPGERTICSVKDLSKEHVEGKDAAVLVPGYKPETKKTVLEEYDPKTHTWTKTRTEYEAGFNYYPVEVKAICGNNFLNRDNDGGYPSGTIGFELWGNWQSNKGHRENWTDNGWFREMVCPRNGENVVQPHLLFFVLYEEDKRLVTAESRPYAVIAFWFAPLKSRLQAYANEQGMNWDFENGLPRPATDDAYWKSHNTPSGQWQVPFSVISDLATVTMVGEEPAFQPKWRCPIDLQQLRLEYLKVCANGRYIP